MLNNIVNYLGFTSKHKIQRLIDVYNRDIAATQSRIIYDKFDETKESDIERLIELRFKIKHLNSIISDLKELL